MYQDIYIGGMNSNIDSTSYYSYFVSWWMQITVNVSSSNKWYWYPAKSLQLYFISTNHLRASLIPSGMEGIFNQIYIPNLTQNLNSDLE